MSLDLARDRPETGSCAPVRARSRVEVQPRLALFAALLVVALRPVLVTPIPAMVDCTNHLARTYLLTSLAAWSGSPFYHLAPAFYLNLAMDMLETPQVERRFTLYRIRTASLARGDRKKRFGDVLPLLLDDRDPRRFHGSYDVSN